jgi:hypothetical protein
VSNLLEIDFDPDDRTLRRFGPVALLGFGLLATCAHFEVFIFAFGLGTARLPVTAGLAALGLLCALLGWLHPRSNRPIYVALSLLTWPVGWVVSHVILALLFFGLITPFGIVLRALGRDPLARRWDAQSDSYWSKRGGERPRARYFRQF